MQNPGEEVVGEYLKIKLNCDFIEYNLHTPDIQGEIDLLELMLRAKCSMCVKSQRIS